MPPPHSENWRAKGSQLLSSLKDYWKDDAESPPAISERTALLCALLFTAAYIAPFYLSPTLRASPLHSRDSPAVIAARVRAVALTCLACTAATAYILVSHSHATPREALRLLGVWPARPADVGRVLALVAALFVGPLYEALVVEGEWRELVSGFKHSVWDDWRGFRNLVVAPASEELVFRSLTIALFVLARADPVRTIVLKTPLIFGLAHIHHLVEFLQTYTPEGRRVPPGKVVLMGLLRSGFQFTYTSLFGFFAAFTFLRTGNLWAVIVAHSFCNKMGVPRLSGRVGQYAGGDGGGVVQDATPDVAQGKKHDEQGIETQGKEASSSSGQAASQGLGIAWTVVYYTLLLVGAYSFYILLWPLTESSNALAKI